MLKLGIKCDRKTRKTWKKTAKWGKLIDHNARTDINIALDSIIDPLISIEDFCTAIVAAGKKLLLEENDSDPGWFKLNKEFLRPLLNHRNELLFQARNSNGNDILLKTRCADARRNVKDAVLLSKDKWVRLIATRVHEMKFFPKEAWKAIKTLRDGHNAHHLDHKPIVFRIANSELTKTDKNVADGLAMHFKDIYNRKVAVD